MNEAPGPINFTMFLTMFGEKLNGTDPEDVIRNAFACFDEEGTGKLLPLILFLNALNIWCIKHLLDKLSLLSQNILVNISASTKDSSG